MVIKRLVGASILCWCLAGLVHATTARVWEGTIEIPTYLLGPEDPNPPFPLVNQNNIYPYSTLDDLTDHRVARSYQAIYIENEYLKAIVLPELGGRLYSLYDKITKREVFYRNNVVKYGMVALRGAWISGGVEFNFPNGHTTDTVSRVSYRVLHEPDGGATVVVGNVDQVSEMHWEVALTLRPGQARLEQRVTLFNGTPTTNLHWYWATAAVPATDDMQFIYPMREVNPHSHTEVWTYPVWQGVDRSWSKNVRRPTSLFGLGVHRDLFGAYYHGPEQGVVHVADYREVPGKKVWTWGAAGDGLIWTGMLTDHDGAYNEIQAGRFETQLSQEFMPPRQVENWTEYWYPVAGLSGGFVEATRDLAINVRVLTPSGSAKGAAEVLVSSTVALAGARVSLKVGEEVRRTFNAVSFQPLVTQRFTAPLEDAEAAKNDLSVEITATDGKPLLHWSAADPIDGRSDFVSTAGEHAAASLPDDKLGTQELFLAAQTDEKERRQQEAWTRYEEVLKRDPNYVPVLLKLAFRAHASGDLAQAQNYATSALAVDETDPQVLYANGVIQRRAGKWNLAQDRFWGAILFGGSPAPAYAHLGEIAIRRQDYAKAQELLRKSLRSNPNDALVQSDLAVALRLDGKVNQAVKAAAEAVRMMPLLPAALAEQWRISSAQLAAGPAALQAARTWRQSLGYASQNYLEAGVWYRNLGDYASSDFILKSAAQDLPANQVSPLVYYYLAANARNRNDAKQAEAFAARAANAPYEGVFPNRIEDAEVLSEAISQNSGDAHAPYFLGNFLFAHGRYDEAWQKWSQAQAQGFTYSVLSRNLGICAWKVRNDFQSAMGFFEQAIRQAPDDFRLYASLDQIYAQLGATEKREGLLAGAPAGVLDRDTVRVRRVLLLIEQHQFDRALEILSGHNFKPWEAGQIFREMFVLAHLEKGRAALATKDYSAAEQAFRKALEYPVNLGVGKPDEPKDEAAHYWLGEALSARGKQTEARDEWQLSLQQSGSEGMAAYYHALNLHRLGEDDQAQRAMKALAEGPSQGRASARDYYLAGLAERFLGNEDQARSHLRRAIEMDSSLWQARIELSRLAGGS
jgi:tetratricopeptide (TPR) repeat protein